LPTTFESGTTLAHYELIAPLGAGGMGEVYRARDTKLDRVVAVKILPPEVVKNDERVRRFVQEAKSASSLNHPNIVTIYEIGQAPAHYIAMELVDGSTLRRLIHDQDTDLRTLIGYLAQAAEGLSKAHEAGIVHRDLKPENIMVTRDGYAKVLDFGLAKLTQKKSDETENSATAVRNETREGALLGTVGYMAPEQVKGKAVDHRADIFSLGCILYEAATRQRPFQADSDVDVMHKIMHDKPVPVDEVNPEAPAVLRRVIRRCMAKDPAKRIQSMKDVALELSDIVDEWEELSVSATSGSGSVSSGVAVAPRRTRIMQLASATIVLAALAFGIYQWREAHAKSQKPVASFGAMRVARLTSSGNVIRAAISPDGKYVAEVLETGDGRYAVSVRQVATGSDVVVVAPSPTPMNNLSFSKDGNYLYYTHAENETGAGYASLFQIPILGGSPRKITFDVDTPVSFSPDGTKMAFSRGFPPESKNAVIIANADGSAQHELLRAERFGTTPTAAHWTPDGKKIITTVRTLQGGLHAELIEIDVATGKWKTIGTGKWRRVFDLALVGDGSAVLMATFPADGGYHPQIWLQPYPEGDAVRVTNDANGYETVSVTADGAALATTMTTDNGDIVVCDGTDESGCKPLTTGTADQQPAEIAVASTGVIVYDFDRGEGNDIAMIDGPGAAPRMLTNDHVSNRPTISADGKTIAFNSRRDGGVPAVFVMDADGGNVRKVAAGGRSFVSPDGKTIIFFGQNSNLFRVSVAGGTPVKLADRVNGAAAIDGRSQRVAYVYWKSENGKNAPYLAVTPIAGGPPQIDMRFTGTGRVLFTAAGDGIMFVRNVNRAQNIFVQPFAGGEPKPLTHFRTGQISTYDLMPDGKFAMTRVERRADVVVINNFR
jgi:Tol biopolymer transport system component